MSLSKKEIEEINSMSEAELKDARFYCIFAFAQPKFSMSPDYDKTKQKFNLISSRLGEIKGRTTKKN
jgi:hypothetical protein